MLAMFHRPRWFQRPPVAFRRDAEPFLAKLPLPTTATFHDDVDYLHHWRPYDVQKSGAEENAGKQPAAAGVYPHEL